MKAELELAAADGSAAPVERLLKDLEEAFGLLTAAEDAEHPPARVLVVDDDDRLAEITARGLRRLGLEAESSSTLRAPQPNEVMVVDLSLLGSLDAPTLSAVRAARPIVVTGATDRVSRALAASVAATDYLVKPVELEDLAAAISRRFAEGSP